MKKIILLYAFLLILFSGFSEGPSLIKMYMVLWNADYTTPRNIDNIKNKHTFYIEILNSDISSMFSDYKECINNLKSQDTISYKRNECNICVELFFEQKMVSIYFLNNGDYYFDGKWYKANYGLYYLLFSYFSNALIPTETLNKARSNMKHNSLWVPNDYKDD